MEECIGYKGIDLSYVIEGEGDSLVFLHGYLESKEIWKDFSRLFTDKYKVICIDIPGHGRSGVLGECHDMDEIALAVDAVLVHEEIENAVLFGHSMGGYAVMEYVYLFPGKLRGYCLFHSTCFADNEEKMNNRDREIGLIKCGKKTQIIRSNIPKGFADSNHRSMQDKLQWAKDLALGSSDDGTVSLLRGMKNRKDHSATLGKPLPPPLLIWGKKDNYISEEVFNRLVGIAPGASVIVLQNSGHMGFIEEPGCVHSGILNYLGSI